MRPCFEMMNLTQICINYYYYYFFFRETKFYNLYYTSYKRSKIIKMIQITYILIDITIKEKIWKNLSIPYHKIKSFPSVTIHIFLHYKNQPYRIPPTKGTSYSFEQNAKNMYPSLPPPIKREKTFRKTWSKRREEIRSLEKISPLIIIFTPPPETNISAPVINPEARMARGVPI